MKYILLVASREYIESVKTKGFWLGLFLFPAILFLSMQAPVWLERQATPTRYFVLLDQSGSLAPVLGPAMERSYQKELFDALKEYAQKNVGANPKSPDEGLPQSVEAFVNQGGQDAYLERLRPNLKAGASPFHAPRRRFQQTELPADIRADADLGTISEALKPYLRHERKISAQGQEVELSAAVLIPRDIDSQIVRPGSLAMPSASHQIQYWSVNSSNSSLRDEIERIVNGEIRRREYLARGLDAAAVHQVEHTYVPFASLNPKKEKGQEAVSTSDVIRQWAPSGFVYLLWVAIFSIMQMLLHNTIEEKSNRIIEVLLSSVTPGELMLGKLFGIAAIGLTMVSGWMLEMFVMLSWKSGGASEIGGQILTVLRTSNLIPMFSIYFLLGYLMHAAAILSLGSVCNTIKEAQSYMAMLTMLMMVPLMTMTFIPKDPNGTLARVLSWIPPYTPFTMMNRAMADPPMVDLIGTLLLLLAVTGIALWMAGKIFRIGILRTGQPPKVLEMLKWAINRPQ